MSWLDLLQFWTRCCSLTIKYRIAYTQVPMSTNHLLHYCTMYHVCLHSKLCCDINMGVLAPSSSRHFALGSTQPAVNAGMVWNSGIFCDCVQTIRGNQQNQQRNTNSLQCVCCTSRPTWQQTFFFICLLFSCHWHNIVIQTQIGHFIRYTLPFCPFSHDLCHQQASSWADSTFWLIGWYIW